jgi:DNA-binding MarR family transcriptional regulator
MNEVDPISPPLARRLRDGLDRIAAALRADQWSAAGSASLNPTQVQVLAFLAGRGEEGTRVKEIAGHLGVSPPTATDSIAALERKGLIEKQQDASDARATRVLINAAGRNVLRSTGMAHSATVAALAALPPDEQTELLILEIKVIRHLQETGAISPQRLCVSCHHFRPNAHDGSARPHHCTFVDAAFGNPDLRIDCHDHEPADPAKLDQNWKVFTLRSG